VSGSAGQRPGNADTTVRVAVFEPRPIVAQGIATLLSDAAGVDVVGATADLHEAIRMVAEADVQVVVFGVPDRPPEYVHDLAVRFESAAASAGRQIGVVCMVPPREYSPVRCGHRDVPIPVSTAVSPQNLRAAVFTAHRGSDGPIPLTVLRYRTTEGVHADPIRAAALTYREREVLAALAEGRSTSEIASQLGISVNTVRTHVQHLMPKLGVHTRLQAVAIAAMNRRIDEDYGGTLP
jgi:DNA-binding NarL/FixJ family response regulator